MFQDYVLSRHSVTKLQVHLIFTTKYRRRVMTPEVLQSVLATLGIAASDLGCTLLEADGEADHVHLLVSYPPKVSISEMVNRFKTRSSRKIREEYPRGISARNIREEYPGILEGGRTGLFWARSYFACTVGSADREVFEKYMEKQTTD